MSKAPRKKPAAAGGALKAFVDARRPEWSPRVDDPRQVDLEDVTKAPPPAPPDDPRQAITFRLRRTTWRRLHDVSLDLTSAEGRKVPTVEVVERALAEYFRGLGLPDV